LVPELIAKSDLITAIPEKNSEKSSYSEQLHIVELPIEVAELQMMWHERKQRDPLMNGYDRN